MAWLSHVNYCPMKPVLLMPTVELPTNTYFIDAIHNSDIVHKSASLSKIIYNDLSDKLNRAKSAGIDNNVLKTFESLTDKWNLNKQNLESLSDSYDSWLPVAFEIETKRQLMTLGLPEINSIDWV